MACTVRVAGAEFELRETLSHPDPFEYSTLVERPVKLPTPPFEICAVWAAGFELPVVPAKERLDDERTMVGRLERFSVTPIVCGELAAPLEATETVAL